MPQYLVDFHRPVMAPTGDARITPNEHRMLASGDILKELNRIEAVMHVRAIYLTKLEMNELRYTSNGMIQFDDANEKNAFCGVPVLKG